MTIYKGHTYDASGNHHLSSCPKCMADMKVADGIAAASDDRDKEDEQ